MKKICFFLFIAAVSILASCSKDGGIDPASDTSDALLKGKPVQGPVIVLPPSGGDDTDELHAVIAAAEPGTVIQLTAGVYHLGYFEVFGFEGCLQGAGRDKTIISPVDKIDQEIQMAMNYLPSWLKFIGGDVTLCDFAVVTGDGSLVKEPNEYYNETLITLLLVNNYNQEFNLADPQPMKFKMRNVDFHCGDLDPELSYLGQPYNVLMAVWVGTDVLWPLDNIILTSGQYDIVNCGVDNAFQGYEGFSLGEDAVVTLDQCSAIDCLYGAYFTASYNTRVFISNDNFNTTLEGVLIEDNDWGLIGWVVPFRSSEYSVTGNVFSAGPGSRCLTFKDSWGIIYPEKYIPISGLVKNNLFNLTEGSTGISCLNNQGAVVKNNRFSGTGISGVYVDGAPVYDIWTGEELGTGESNNVLILGNNFNGLTATEADIVLGEHSSYCTVVGNGKDDLIDLGVDNRVTGMNKMNGGTHIGPSIRDNFRMMPRMKPGN